MEKRRVFTVAGHSFAIRLEESDPVWSELLNYKPFLVKEDVECLFELSLSEEVEGIPRQLLFSTSEGTLEPRLDLFNTACKDELIVEMAPVSTMEHIATLSYVTSRKIQNLQVLKPEMKKFAIDNSLMLMYALATATLGTLEMHSSVIVNGGKAYMFLGHSGAGKSTHSKLWLENIEGSSLLNDDNPIIRIEDGKPIVYGSPWSGKTHCYKNERCPIGGFLRIVQDPQNIITPLEPIAAYAEMFTSCSGIKGEDAEGDGIHNSIMSVILNVPFFKLQCRADAEAAKLSSSTFFNLQ